MSAGEIVVQVKLIHGKATANTKRRQAPPWWLSEWPEGITHR